MAPLALEQIAEDISDHQQAPARSVSNERIRFQCCRSKAVLSSIASGLIGYSTGYAIQVGGRRILPGFVKSYYLLPLLLAAYLPTWTFSQLMRRCEVQFTNQQKYVVNSDTEQQKDTIALS